MNYKKLSIGVGVAIVVLLLLSVLANPLLIKAIKAKYKSTEHFISLKQDDRILYESAAKENAVSLAGSLNHYESTVEDIMGWPFKKPIAVYICATQDSFNEYVYLSKNVRGAMYWEKVFLSPGAFNRDSLENLMTHELTHYLFYSYLGERESVTNIPLWFREGIAVYVANGGKNFSRLAGVKGRMHPVEKEAFLTGKTDAWFASDNPVDAMTKNGKANMLLYNVSAAVVHFMRDEQPKAFEALIEKLLSGSKFDEALSNSYKKSTDEILADFTSYLKN